MRSLLCDALALVALIGPLAAADQPVLAGDVRLGAEGVRTLPALVQDMVEQTGAEIHIDVRHENDKVFLPAGNYDAAELLDILCFATGLKPRGVGGLIFLAGTKEGYALLRGLPSQAERTKRDLEISARLQAVLGDFVRQFPFAEYAMPFAAEDFLGSKRMRFGELSAAQQAFILAKVRDPDGLSVVFTQDTAVRLVAAFHIVLGAFAEEAPPLPEELRGIPGAEQQWQQVTEGFRASRRYITTIQ